MIENSAAAVVLPLMQDESEETPTSALDCCYQTICANATICETSRYGYGLLLNIQLSVIRLAILYSKSGLLDYGLNFSPLGPPRWMSPKMRCEAKDLCGSTEKSTH